MNDLNSTKKTKPAEVSKSTLSDLLRASEAVYGLLAWLTCRDTPVTFSARHDAAIAAELADEFCKTNNLSEPREDYHYNLISPTGEIAVAGRGSNS